MGATIVPKRSGYDGAEPAAAKAAKDDKDDTIMTPIKEAKQDQWWGSSHSEYVVDTTITNDANG